MSSSALITAAADSMRGKVEHMPRRLYPVHGLREVDFCGVGVLTIRQGDDENLIIDGDDEFLRIIEARVEGERLVMGFCPRSTHPEGPEPMYHLTMRGLSALTLMCGGDIRIPSLTTDHLTVTNVGGISLAISHLQAERLTIVNRGSIEAVVSGRVEREDVEMLGSGVYNAEDLDTWDASVCVAGSEDVAVRANDSLSVTVTCSGTVHCFGPARSTQSTAGSGQVVTHLRDSSIGQ